MTGPNLPQSVAQWIAHADHDLLTAERAMAPLGECPADTICFLAQQCAEKYLKSLLVFRDTDFPLIHDLLRLVDLLPATDQGLFTVWPLQTLSGYAIEGRYPGYGDPLERADAEAAVETAREIRRIVRALMAVGGPSPAGGG